MPIWRPSKDRKYLELDPESIGKDYLRPDGSIAEDTLMEDYRMPVRVAIIPFDKKEHAETSGFGKDPKIRLAEEKDKPIGKAEIGSMIAEALAQTLPTMLQQHLNPGVSLPPPPAALPEIAHDEMADNAAATAAYALPPELLKQITENVRKTLEPTIRSEYETRFQALANALQDGRRRGPSAPPPPPPPPANPIEGEGGFEVGRQSMKG